MALATAPFGAPGLYSDWGRISLRAPTAPHMLETRVSRRKLIAPSGLAEAASDPRPQLRRTGRYRLCP